MGLLLKLYGQRLTWFTYICHERYSHRKELNAGKKIGIVQWKNAIPNKSRV